MCVCHTGYTSDLYSISSVYELLCNLVLCYFVYLLCTDLYLIDTGCVRVLIRYVRCAMILFEY